MQIAAYTTDEDVPAHMRHIAHVIAGSTLVQIRFEAESADGARRRAEEWLAAETERAKRQGITAARPAPKRKRKIAP